ncbi:ANTAR domain-containing protein [Streptomyces sp. NPDC001415]
MSPNPCPNPKCASPRPSPTQPPSAWSTSAPSPPPHTTTVQLRTALHSRIAIEQAKGFLSHRLATTPDTAFDLMRRYSRSRGHRLTDVAHRVLDDGLLPT